MYTEQRNLPEFNSILLKALGNVVVSRGGEQSVTVTSNRDIVASILTEVNNGELVISIKETFPLWLLSFPNIEIRVVMKDIRRLKVAGVGKLRSEQPLEADTLEVLNTGVGGIHLQVKANKLVTKLKGVGEIELEGETTEHEVEISGTGKVNAYRLVSKNAVVSSSGIGECLVHVTEKLSVDSSGIGKVKYRGAPVVQSKQSGMGSIESIP